MRQVETIVTGNATTAITTTTATIDNSGTATAAVTQAQVCDAISKAAEEAGKNTRGEFIVLMMRAYSIVPDTNLTDNFSDAGNTYYTNYLAAAKRLGITGGVGNNMFAPEKEITRQEMFTLLYNALKGIGELPLGSSGKRLSAFSDAGQIESWAKEAMTLLVETGTIGGNNGMLTPASTTTRAEMAQVLCNLLSK